MKKKTLALFLALALAMGLFAAPAYAEEDTQTQAEMPFTDVEGHWAYNDIQYCFENGLFNGRTATTFEPEGTLTVAEAVALAGRLCYWTHGGTGSLPDLPDLTKPYARFYDENGTEIAVLGPDRREMTVGNGYYVSLSSTYDDPAIPETCMVEAGLEGFLPTRTCKGTRQTYAPTGHMSYGLSGTGYCLEDAEVFDNLLTLSAYVHPEKTTAESVNEWWYPADFYLRYYGDYSAITDMCFHISNAHPDEDGRINTDYDAVAWFPKENATRAWFACLIDGAVSEELPVLNSEPSIPDVKPMEHMDSDAILRLYGAGIITGMDNLGSFNPDGVLTRAQAATILARVLDPARRITLS